jgi:hypothetical protein
MNKEKKKRLAKELHKGSNLGKGYWWHPIAVSLFHPLLWFYFISVLPFLKFHPLMLQIVFFLI